MSDQRDQRDNQVDLDFDGVWPADESIVEDFPLCIPPVVPTAGQLALARAAAIQVVYGPPVLPHVEAAAFHVADATGVTWISTYNGHHPTAAQALDIFVPVNDPALGWAVCDWLWARRERYGLWYQMYRRKIRNVEVAGGAWRDVPDRGSPTANHEDHGHNSFYATAPEEDFLAALSDDEQREVLDRLRVLTDKAQYGNDVLTEFKKIASDAVGQPNWHEVGKGANAMSASLFNILGDIKNALADIKKSMAKK